MKIIAAILLAVAAATLRDVQNLELWQKGGLIIFILLSLNYLLSSEKEKKETLIFNFSVNDKGKQNTTIRITEINVKITENKQSTALTPYPPKEKKTV